MSQQCQVLLSHLLCKPHNSMDRHHYPSSSPEEKANIQRGQVAFPRPHSWEATENCSLNSSTSYRGPSRREGQGRFMTCGHCVVDGEAGTSHCSGLCGTSEPFLGVGPVPLCISTVPASISTLSEASSSCCF